MKLIVFSLTVSSSGGNGRATLCRAFQHRGHRTVFFEHDVPYYASHRNTTAHAECELVLYSDWDDVQSRTVRELDDTDVDMVTSYCPNAIEATCAVLDSLGRQAEPTPARLLAHRPARTHAATSGGTRSPEDAA